jgi:hypothetical protein
MNSVVFLSIQVFCSWLVAKNEHDRRENKMLKKMVFLQHLKYFSFPISLFSYKLSKCQVPWLVFFLSTAGMSKGAICLSLF